MPNVLEREGCPAASSGRHACGLPQILGGAVPPSLDDSHSEACVQSQRPEWPIAVPSLQNPVPADEVIYKNRLGSLRLTRTSVRRSVCLALTLLPGFGRRCPRARIFFVLASSLDFLQGTFEKIYFLHFLAQETFQLTDLLGKRELPSIWGSDTVRLCRLQLLSPLVQQTAINAQFF